MKAIMSEEVIDQMTLNQSDLRSEVSISDHRQYIARIPLEVPMRVASFQFSASASTIDVSVSGLQVRTRLPLTLGERVILTIQDDENISSLNICGEVVRLISDPEQNDSPLYHPKNLNELFAEVARLTMNSDGSGNFCYGLRILKDDATMWQNFVRMQVL
jgi:PilZ domain